ncbi:MAG: hypothetical protein EKK62_09645 [Acidimicrobiia bacterium]|nr:MAG: hypothetical protein EKK62_09645 [Acidimicrobiia bacterium]
MGSKIEDLRERAEDALGLLDVVRRERDALRAEVELLREALANLLDYYQDSSENDAIAKARAALRSEGEVKS